MGKRWQTVPAMKCDSPTNLLLARFRWLNNPPHPPHPSSLTVPHGMKQMTWTTQEDVGRHMSHAHPRQSPQVWTSLPQCTCCAPGCSKATATLWGNQFQCHWSWKATVGTISDTWTDKPGLAKELTKTFFRLSLSGLWEQPARRLREVPAEEELRKCWNSLGSETFDVAKFCHVSRECMAAPPFTSFYYNTCTHACTITGEPKHAKHLFDTGRPCPASWARRIGRFSYSESCFQRLPNKKQANSTPTMFGAV